MIFKTIRQARKLVSVPDTKIEVDKALLVEVLSRASTFKQHGS
jgi:hypothetical protein